MQENAVIKQIIDVDEKTLDTMTKWMFDWWGKKENYSYDGVRCFLSHSLLANRLPQTYGLFLDSNIIGMFQLTYEDLNVRPDIYPWLANLYIDEKYRGKGYGRLLLENVKRIAKEQVSFDEIFLYTKHRGLYERFGWKYMYDIDTYNNLSRIERLYKLDLKDN